MQKFTTVFYHNHAIIIAKLEVELEDFKTALSALYTDVHSQD